jgi:hypothetical protein
MALQNSIEWQRRIEAAQGVVEFTVAGRKYPRIRYGDEGAGWGQVPCRDCGAHASQYHVPNCEYEKCPVCEIISAAASGHTCDIEELREVEGDVQLAWWQGGSLLDGIERWLKRVIIWGALLAAAYLAFRLLT